MAQQQKLSFVTEHYPPFQIVDNKNVSGLSVDILRAAMEGTSIDYSISVYPWFRAYNAVTTEEKNCIFLISRTAEREEHFYWTESMLSHTDYLIGLSDRDLPDIAKLEDAMRYNIAVIKGDRTHAQLLNEGFIEGKNLFVVSDTYSQFKLLQRKEVDFIISGQASINYRAITQNISPDAFKTYIKVSKTPVNLYIACNKNTPIETVTTLSNAIRAVKRQPYYKQLTQKWLTRFVSNN